MNVRHNDEVHRLVTYINNLLIKIKDHNCFNCTSQSERVPSPTSSCIRWVRDMPNRYKKYEAELIAVYNTRIKSDGRTSIG